MILIFLGKKMSEQLEQLDKEYVLHTYARNYVNFKKYI